MADNIIIQEFNNLFVYSMNGILQGIYDFSDRSIYWILGLSFFLYIVSLRKWFDNRAQNEALLEMIQFLQTNNEKLADRINTMDNQVS